MATAKNQQKIVFPTDKSYGRISELEVESPSWEARFWEDDDDTAEGEESLAKAASVDKPEAFSANGNSIAVEITDAAKNASLIQTETTENIFEQFMKTAATEENQFPDQAEADCKRAMNKDTDEGGLWCEAKGEVLIPENIETLMYASEPHLETWARCMPRLNGIRTFQQIPDETTRHFKTFQSLKLLSIQGSKISNKSMAHIGTLANLEFLDLSGALISDAAAPALNQLQNLKTLILSRSKFTEHGLSQLHIKGLERLGAANIEVSTNAITIMVRNLQNIRSLDLASSGLENDGLRALAPLANSLEYLELSYTEVDDEGLRTLSNMKKLKGLNLSGTPCTGKGFGHLPEQIESLEVSDVKDLQGVSRLHRLKQFMVSGCKSSLVQSIRKKAELRAVWLQEVRLDEDELQLAGVLNTLPKLQNLDLSDSKIGDIFIANLGCGLQLRDLQLDATLITDEAIGTIASWTNLTSLGLSRTRITDASIPYLSRLPKLSSIEIELTLISERGAAELRARCPDLYVYYEEQADEKYLNGLAENLADDEEDEESDYGVAVEKSKDSLRPSSRESNKKTSLFDRMKSMFFKGP